MYFNCLFFVIKSYKFLESEYNLPSLHSLEIKYKSDVTHIAQNIAERCQKYFQSFIAIEILPQHFCQLFQNTLLQLRAPMQ